MAEQLEEAVKIGRLLVTAIQFFFTVAGKDQDRSTVRTDVIQGSRFIDSRLQRFQSPLVAGFEMSDYLTAERDDPGELVSIFSITRQQLLVQPDQYRPDSRLRNGRRYR